MNLMFDIYIYVCPMPDSLRVGWYDIEGSVLRHM